MKFKSYEDIMELVTKRNRISRLILLTIGSFIAALIYNIFVSPNSLVYGGIGGVAIIANKLIGLNEIIFIDIATIILVLISLIVIGPKKTSYTIIGYGMYAIMVSLTAPLAKYITFNFDSFLFNVLLAAIIDGFGYGLIYKCGFNTGGADSIIAITQHFFKVPTAKLSTIINGIIVISGAFVFGIDKTIYAIIYLKIMNFVSNYIILGTSTSKLVFIKTKELNQIEEYLKSEINVGYTLIDSGNGISFLRKKIIMCIVPSEMFYNLKKDLITIDKKIEIISNDCYTVEGGTINKLIKV